MTKGCLAAVINQSWIIRVNINDNLQIRAAATVWPSIPKTLPHMVDWKVCMPYGTGILPKPSMLRSGMETKPEVQRVVALPPAAAEAVVVPRIPKGSGELVEDCFH